MTRLIHIFLLLFVLAYGAMAQYQYASNSVLNEGKWVKIEIEKTGVYKLTYADLKKMGFDNPEKVSVYGYGGFPIYEDFSKGYIDDLPPVAVWKGNDYLLFYGQGVTRWEYRWDSDLLANAFVHTNNPYSIKAYYFLTDRDGAARTMESEASITAAAIQRVTNFDDYKVYDNDLISLNTSGRELFGESLKGRSTPLALDFPRVPGITNDPAYVTMRFVARPTNRQGQAILYIGEEELIKMTIDTTNNSYTVANENTLRRQWTGDKTETIDMKVSYSNPSDENVHLDYVRLEMMRELKNYGAFTAFRSLASVNQKTRFVIQGANEYNMVWDVTDPQNIKQMETTLSGAELSFSIDEGPLREFVLVQTNQTFETPKKTKDIVWQDLHGMEQLDMVIIALPFMKEQAERLAEAHHERDGLRVKVIDPHEIYNEFSSGTPDASAYRRFMKMFYDRGTTKEDKPRYLLLFGGGLYDNRGICSKIQNTYPASTIHDRLLLTFQSENSLDMYSYVTDDYFGLMQEKNADALLSRDPMSIAVGRFPIRTETEARQVVDKVIGYMENKQPGSWKNALAFLADDGNSGDDFTTEHMRQASDLADEIEKNHPEFLSHKILFDAYKKDFSNTDPYPEVRKRIEQLQKSGLLLLNYSGHGSTQSLSDEKVITQEDIATASYTKLPMWVTATCDFTRFDALASSAGEQVMLNRTSGGIGLFTTTRVVTRNQNFTLNLELVKHLFDKEEGKRLTIGEVMQRTKNALSGVNKLNFILIGDPAMRLAYPDYKIEITSVNGKPASEMVDIQASDKVTVTGEIFDVFGNPASDFNGMVYPTVLDSRDSTKTLNNNGKGGVFTFAEYPSTIFVGNDKVENGKFSFTFTVSKNISYSYKQGKMSLYAYDETSGIEAQGAFRNYRVGGTAPNPETDTEGPEIRSMFLNDSSFVSGDKVNSTPLFIANLWDKSGVNITGSSIGHDMMLIIDGNSALSYNLNTYYEMMPGTDGEGRVIFPIPNLPDGLHTAEFISWDVFNNSSRDSLSFVVSQTLKPQLIDIYATPNPARDQVEFRLVHNRPESMVTVEIRVFNMAGRLLWTGQQRGSSESFKDFILSWDLNDHTGSRLLPGVYVYRASIKTKYSKEATKGNKLIILAQ